MISNLSVTLRVDKGDLLAMLKVPFTPEFSFRPDGQPAITAVPEQRGVFQGRLLFTAVGVDKGKGLLCDHFGFGQV